MNKRMQPIRLSELLACEFVGFSITVLLAICFYWWNIKTDFWDSAINWIYIILFAICLLLFAMIFIVRIQHLRPTLGNIRPALRNNIVTLRVKIYSFPFVTIASSTLAATIIFAYAVHIIPHMKLSYIGAVFWVLGLSASLLLFEGLFFRSFFAAYRWMALTFVFGVTSALIISTNQFNYPKIVFLIILIAS